MVPRVLRGGCCYSDPQERLREHGAREINVCLGAVGAPTAKCVPFINISATNIATCIVACCTLVRHGVKPDPEPEVSLVGTAPFLADIYEQMTEPRRQGRVSWGLDNLRSGSILHYGC